MMLVLQISVLVQHVLVLVPLDIELQHVLVLDPLQALVLLVHLFRLFAQIVAQLLFDVFRLVFETRALCLECG